MKSIFDSVSTTCSVLSTMLSLLLLSTMSSIAAGMVGPSASSSKITLDHIVYVVPDLEMAMDELQQRLGVRPVMGGKHVGLGTHNSLLGLGGNTYLELFAPDPDATNPLTSIIGVDGKKPRIATYCCDAGTIGIDVLTKKLQETTSKSLFPGHPAEAGSRPNPDGSVVSWKVAVDKHTVPSDELPGGGLVPFLIEWDKDCYDVRPCSVAPQGCKLRKLRGYHPNPSHIRSLLQEMMVDEQKVDIQEGPEPKLILELETPNGIVELE